MRHGRLRVVKVGGSLLTLERLEQAFRAWLQSQPPASNVLVVGGGLFADVVREADAQFALDPEQSHWLAIQAMGLSAQLVHGLLPDAVMVCRLAMIHTIAGIQSLLIVDPEPLLRTETARLGPDRLPHDWGTTSDSIAALIAEAIDADELVLLKSAPMTAENWQAAADAGFVDRYFPIAAAAIGNIRAVNLRDAALRHGPIARPRPSESAHERKSRGD